MVNKSKPEQTTAIKINKKSPQQRKALIYTADNTSNNFQTFVKKNYQSCSNCSKNQEGILPKNHPAKGSITLIPN